MESRYRYAEFKEDEKVEGESPVLYSMHSINNGYKLEEVPELGFTDLLDGWSRAAYAFPDNNCMGHIEGDKYVWRTYKEAHLEAQALAKAIYTLNLLPEIEAEGKKFQMLGLYSRNRPEWALCNWGIMHFCGTVVTLYNTLGEESLKYAFDHTDLAAVGCDERAFQKCLELKSKGFLATLKNVIAFDAFSEEEEKSFTDLGVTVHSYSSLVEKGREIDDKILDEMVKPNPDTTDVICFTSGTTGVPKGAMISHRNYTANIKGAEDNDFSLTDKDVIISYMPLAHCYEKWLMAICLSRGVAIGYFRGDPTKLVQDIQMLKPTVMPSVPRVLTKLYDTVNMLMSKESWKFKLFKAAIKNKLFYVHKQAKFTHLLWDSILFKYLKGIVGGRVRFMITGSAPISPEILDTLKCCFSCQIIEGYGQTETNAPVTTTNMADSQAGHVGGPFSCCCFKTVDIPDMEYTAQDKPYPRGELCIKGPVVVQGYYKNEEKTKEAFDDDGWLHTGDVIEIWDNGTVRLIDRKKNLFKLGQGEYISPEKLENIYNKSQFIAQIFVTGDSLRSYIVGVIVPDEEYCKMWAIRIGLSLEGDDLYNSTEFKEALEKDLAERHAHAGLNSLEKLKKYHLTREPFSVENNLLTPSQKLMRFSARKHFKDIVDALYASDDN